MVQDNSGARESTWHRLVDNMNNLVNRYDSGAGKGTRHRLADSWNLGRLDYNIFGLKLLLTAQGTAPGTG